MELYDEIDEELVLILTNGKLFSDFPKLLSHPIGYDGDILQIVNIAFDIGYFVSK